MGKVSALWSRTAVRRAVWIVGSVLLLAAVIFGVSAISNPKKSGAPSTIELTPSETAQQLAVQADIAASRDQTATARQLAEKALKLDATNAAASDVIKRLDAKAAAKKSVSTPAAVATATPAATPDTYSTAVKDVGALLPDAIAGWTKGSVSVQGGEGLVTYEPKTSSPEYRTTVRVTFSVHDRESAAKATSFVDSTIKRVYASEGAAVTVGTQAGYTGTDGARLAVISFARGRYAFEALVYARPGVSAAQMKALALQMAGQLPAAR